MFNHACHRSAACNAAWRFVGGALQVRATRAVRGGEQLRFDYHPALSGRSPLATSPPLYFALYYGFVD
eukprot:gene11700-16646_t